MGAVVADESNEVFDGAGASILDGRGLGVTREELDGWEAANLVGNVIEGCVDFGDGYLAVVDAEETTEFFVLGCETRSKWH